ncbi:hypothetical protein Tco_1056766 [Tanacetum coccineum]|uniref:Uncharacterized protein n=1 Tax=Tanacetum coccineum TaxID=301880 RepID=A0ABQ5H4Q8_9ASTR
MMVITLMFISLDSRKLRLNSRCEASLAKLAKDVVKPNLTHLRSDVKKVRPWNKAHGLRDYMLDYAYDVSVSSQDRIDVEPPSKVNWFADVLVKCQEANEEELDFETQLGKIYYWKVHRVQVLDFAKLAEIEYSDMDMTERLRMQHMGADGEGQALKKVITTDLFFLRSIDEGTVVNVPYLLAQYLFRHAYGRKAEAHVTPRQSLSNFVTLLLNLNTDAKSGSARNEVVTSKAIGVGVGVACYRRGLKEGGGGGMVVLKANVISVITVTAGETFSKFRSFSVESDKTKELCIGPSVFCMSWTAVSVT